MATSGGKSDLRSVQPTFGDMSVATYGAKVNTPAKNPDYFRLFHALLVERAVKSKAGKVVLLDVACGPAQELDFFKDDKRVELVGVDIAQDLLTAAQARLPFAKFFCWDVRQTPPLPSDIAPGSVDVGIALNAMIYVPDKMLGALGYGLKIGRAHV